MPLSMSAWRMVRKGENEVSVATRPLISVRVPAGPPDRRRQAARAGHAWM
jgi:hypothetical protein